MNRFFKLTLIEWKLTIRNFMTIFFALIFPLLMLFLFGSIYGNKPSEILGGHGSIDYSVPAYICMIIAVTGLMSLPLTLAQYRERKILKRFMVTPIKPTEILLSQLVVNAVTTILGLILLIILGKIVYNLHFFGNFFEITLAFIIVLLSIFAVGLLIAGVSKNGKTATTISYIIYFPMLFLSGATIPLEIMPQGVVSFSKILPLTYGVNLLQGIWLGDHLFNHVTDLIVLFSIILIFSVLSIKYFKWE